MEAEEIAHPVGLRGALAIVFGEFDRRAIAAGHHGDEPVDLAVGEVKVGPFERLDGDGRIADRNAIADPRVAPAALPKLTSSCGPSDSAPGRCRRVDGRIRRPREDVRATKRANASPSRWRLRGPGRWLRERHSLCNNEAVATSHSFQLDEIAAHPGPSSAAGPLQSTKRSAATLAPPSSTSVSMKPSSARSWTSAMAACLDDANMKCVGAHHFPRSGRA